MEKNVLVFFNSCKDNGLCEYKNECLNKCNENIYVDELSFICYDNCRDNDNISRIITYIINYLLI